MSKILDNIDDFLAEQKGLDARDAKIESLKGQLADEKKTVCALMGSIEKMRTMWVSSYQIPKVAKKKPGSGKYYIRVAFGDLHGCDQDIKARDALIHDLEILQPEEIVILGDWLNCGGVFSRWQRVHVSEYSYTYGNDVAAGNDSLDLIQKACPNTTIRMLKGNHEARIDKWAARSFSDRGMAEKAIEAFGVHTALHLERRGITWYENNECHDGLYKPGVILLGKCGFTHGYAGGKHPTERHMLAYGINIVQGHNHREQSYSGRTAKDPKMAAWCPGCLCILQQYYEHERPSDHTHGYHLQFVDRKTGWFSGNNIAIINGVSLLHLVDFKGRKDE